MTRRSNALSTAISRRRWLAATTLSVMSTTVRQEAVRAVQFAPTGAGAADRPDVPWLAEVQRPANEIAAAAQLAPLLIDSAGQPISDWPAWQARRRELRRLWSEYIGEFRSDGLSSDFTVLETDERAGCKRKLIRYQSEPGLPVEAYLLAPLDQTLSLPGAVVFHSTANETIRQPAGLEGDPDAFIGLRLARRGFMVLCPRCFLWQGPGSYDEHVAAFHRRHPHSRGMAKMLADGVRAVDVLASMPEVDADRVGAVGHSLGAKETLYLAAFDERVRAAVASEGGIGRTFSNWDAPWYLGEPPSDPQVREHHELLALVAPRPFLVVGGDSADGNASWPFILAARTVYELADQRPVRLGLFNHRQGHALPQVARERIEEWLMTYV